MHVQVPGTCGHHNVNWKGTNGYQWRWTCEDCGRTESVRKEPGRERPVPGVNDGRVQMASTSASPAASLSRAGGVHDAEVLFGGSEDWYQYQSLLQRMVESHMELHGQMTRGEFMQMVNAVMICFRSFGLRTLQAGIPPLPSRSSSQQDALSTTTRSSTGGLHSAGLQRMTFGAHKGRTFTETYEQYPDYVDWTLSEAEHSAGFCACMHKWMTYCHNWREDEIQGTVYMVAEDAGEDETDPDDVLLYLDSGCNVTCHGELWERRYVRATGNRPTWVHQGEGSLRGIGGRTRTTGVKEFYVGLEGENGERVPVEIVSTEIAGSNAPLLLSIKGQRALGLVVDFAHFTVYSRLLDLTFKAVKGRKNGLIGLRMLPGPDVTPLALMAEEDEEEETPPWRRGEASSSRDRSRSRVTTGTMDVPGVQGFTREERGIPVRGPRVLPSARPQEEEDASAEARATPAMAFEDDAEEEVCVEDEEAEDQWEEYALDPEETDDDRRRTASEPEGEIEALDRGDHCPDSPDEGDYWTMQGLHLIRNHVQKRRTLYHPVGCRLDLPVSRDRLYFHGGIPTRPIRMDPGLASRMIGRSGVCLLSQLPLLCRIAG